MEDIVYPDVGHEISPDMVKELIRFVAESLGAEVRDSRPKSSEVTKGSKI